MANPVSVNASFPAKYRGLFEPYRYKILYGGRGAGRSWACARALLLLGAKRPLRILCAREIQDSIKDSVHKLLGDQIDLLGLQSLYEVQRDTIRGVAGPGTGTEFIFTGLRHNASRVKSYEGIDICWVEESDNTTDQSLEYLIPTIRKERAHIHDSGPSFSELWFTFNPKSEDDPVYHRFITNSPPMAWVQKTTWRDNPKFPSVLRVEMLDMREKDYDKYLHVWEGECRVVLDGAIFADEIRELMTSGRVTDVPYSRAVGVNVYFDLGRADFTAMWFVQRVGLEWRVLDFYQNRGKHISHYAEIMRDKGYIYDTVWLPHDGRAQTLGSKMSIQEQLRATGVAGSVRIVPKLSVQDRINAGRTAFQDAYFDQTRCRDGLKCLREYKWTVRENGTFSDKPFHDEASDGADAWCYFGVASRYGVRTVEELGRRVDQQDERLGEAWTHRVRRVVGLAQGWMR